MFPQIMGSLRTLWPTIGPRIALKNFSVVVKKLNTLKSLAVIFLRETVEAAVNGRYYDEKNSSANFSDRRKFTSPLV